MPTSKVRKINGIVNNCGLNCAIPSVLDQFERLSQTPHEQTAFDTEYSELKNIFKSYYKLQDISFKQLYDFISTKHPDVQEFILGPILRQYYEQNLQEALPSLQITKFENDDLAAKSLALKFSLAEDYGIDGDLPEDIPQNSLLKDGVFRASSFNLLQKYFYPKLGIQTTVTTVVKPPDTQKFKPVGVVKVESQKEESPVDNHLDNINLYYVSEHYELLHPEDDKTIYDSLKDEAKRSKDFKELEMIRTSFGPDVKQAVESFFTKFKTKIYSEITQLISREENEMNSKGDLNTLFQVSSEPIPTPKANLEATTVVDGVLNSIIENVVITATNDEALAACEQYTQTTLKGGDESKAYQVFYKAIEKLPPSEFSSLPTETKVRVANIDAEHEFLTQYRQLKRDIEKTEAVTDLTKFQDSESIKSNVQSICNFFDAAGLTTQEKESKEEHYKTKLMSELAPAIEKQKEHLTIMSKFEEFAKSFTKENPSQGDLQKYSRQKELLLEEAKSYGTERTSKLLIDKLTKFE